MSPELKKYYSTKQRRMAFYIVENELNNEETPPEVSAVIGRDIEMEAGIRVNREINSNTKKDINKEDKNTIKKKIIKKNGMHCPSLPTQWRNNFDIIIPRAQFGHFSATRRG